MSVHATARGERGRARRTRCVLAALAATATVTATTAASAASGVAVPRAVTVFADADGGAGFVLRCPAGGSACRGTAELELAGVATPPAVFDLRSGRKGTLRLGLREEQRASLRAAGTLAGTLRSSSDAGGGVQGAAVLVRAAELPATAPDSGAMHRWTPTAYDTCPAELHDAFAVVGPDGKRYPTWHPPVVLDPATGESCTFGHEHGSDPRGSDIYAWVVKHFTHKGAKAWAGIPFGLVNEALDVYAAQPGNEGTATRAEDNVGHKVDFANDVELLAADGRTPLGVTCDFLFKLHQGSHSLDATRNNVHELIYAAKCSDGTRLISSTLSAFGAPNEFHESCAPRSAVTTSGAPEYPSGGGGRFIANRRCVDTYVLVDPGQGSSLWALYENWRSQNVLETEDGQRLAFFDPDFAVFNPARFSDVTAAEPQGIGRTLDLAWDPEEPANRYPWTVVSHLEPFAYADPRSPFDGAEREFYIGQNQVSNLGGPRYWHSDPYGRAARTTRFPGSVRQLVAALDNSSLPALERQLFGRGHDHGGPGSGVHAPN